MATVGGLSNSTSSSLSGYGASIKGYGGLASGLDTDSLIEGMTLGTRTKIDELLKKKTKTQWQADAYRSVSDKLVDVQTKYLDTLNPSSLYRASFFDKSLVTMNGSNSEYLNVTGASKLLDNMKVLGVGQMAKDASLITNGQVSSKSMSTGKMDLMSTTTIASLNGESLKFTYGTSNYTISLKSGSKITKTVNGEEKTFTTDFTTLDSTVESLNKILENTSLTGVDGMLGDKIKVDKDGNRLIIKLKNPDSNTVELSGGTDKALELLGFKSASNGDIVGGGTITTEGLRAAQDVVEKDLTYEKQGWQIMAGKSITFNYNGTSKDIKMPEEDEFNKWIKDYNGTTLSQEIQTKLRDHIQSQMNRAFGKEHVVVEINDDAGQFSFTFKTKDDSSILTIKQADDGLMGSNGLLGVDYGISNRLNLEASISKSNLVNIPAFGEKNDEGKYTESDYIDKDGNLRLKINDVDIKGLTVDSSLADIMRAINASDAGVKMNYLSTADKFTLTATTHGEAGNIKLGSDFAEVLFGTESKTNSAADTAPTYTKTGGQDAVMLVEYEGGVQGVIKRDTNVFSLDGSTFTLKAEFGLTAKDEGKDLPDQPVQGAVKLSDGTWVTYSEADKTGKGRVSFTTSVDAEKIAKAVSSLVEDYNAIVKEVYEQVSTKPDRNYEPLTNTEKGDLSESEIKNWETEAKKGILFNDSLLRSLSDRLRTVFTGSVDAGTLKKLGLTVSSSYKDSGKIYFDEETFKAAVMEDPEKIKNIFTRPVVTDANGNVTDKGGISVRLKAITYEFANTIGTHGSLIKKAGSAYSPLAETDNSLKKIRDDIDTQVEELKKKLQTEIDRYSKQFTSLERLIAQMNSQSSWLSQATGM